MVSRKRLQELLSYDPETGEFHWKIGRKGTWAGTLAGSPNGRGYLRITIDGKRYCAHRLAWLYVTGDWPADCIDHINGERADNRFSNLRQATRSENMQNTAISPNNTSGFPGVSLCGITGKWQAHIGFGGKSIRIGRFETPEDAHAAYLLKKAELHKFQPTLRSA